ncbi:hypothetical protein [Streptomyces sp. NPDC127112]|uniref:hypothetical protein n=1 Tax=Streptomyces sp. NPDC127112 TaxID=3345364 RepID=UPI00362CE2E0
MGGSGEVRSDVLSSLFSRGAGTDPRHLGELAVELGIPVADLLVVAGRPVPAGLLPPGRDAKVMKQFAHRVSHCDHSQLAALVDFTGSLPRPAAPEPFVEPRWPGKSRPPETRLAALLCALLRNRGFGIRELPFLGLSLSTLRSMVWRCDPSPHRQQQLAALAGPLGWTLPDLFAVAGEPYPEGLRPVVHCHHLGQVFTAAVPLTTAQLIETAREADRLSLREDRGTWQPVSEGFAEQCPDRSEELPTK